MAASLEANDIESDNAAALAIDKHVGRNILDDAGVTANHRKSADSTKLMHSHSTRHKGPIFNKYVATKH